MRKLAKKTFIIVLLCLMIMGLASCKKSDSDRADTYYAYRDGVKQDNEWIKLGKDKWSDSSGGNGRLEEKDGILYGYTEASGKEDVLFFGSVMNGVFEYSFDGENWGAYYADGSNAGNKNPDPHMKDDSEKDVEYTRGGVSGNAKAIGNADASGDYLYFGSYPQTLVMDDALIGVLTSEAGALPTSENSQAWTSYNYYIEGSDEESFMWYIDLSYDGKKYRGVYFTDYRPWNTMTVSDDSNDRTYQDDNGYYKSTDTQTNIYWFKYEPIKWRILSEENDEALILCDMIIDSQDYYYSDMDRGWCSELYERHILGYNGTGVNIKYDDCNPFGMIAGDFGEIDSLTKHTTKTASDSTIDAFNSLSELFAAFMVNFEIPTDGTEYIPFISSDALDDYTSFYNAALELYNGSLVSFTKNVSNDLSGSAVIGANHPYTMAFGTDISPELINFQTVIANLFGFSSKTEFMNYAKNLASTYSQYRTDVANSTTVNEALENGCFYTTNGSFVFPIAVKNKLSSTVLAYVILDTSGFVSVWVNDITAALWATNFNASYHTDSIINNELYCKNILFITGPDLTRSAVIGVNHPYTMAFGTDVSPELINFQTVIANLFGFSSVSDFMDYAQDLADTYAEHRTNIANSLTTNKALENGCFYTTNGSFVFPIAVKNDLSSKVLVYLILDNSGLVSVWVNDITAALKATNFNSSYHTGNIVNNELYCKNILFVTGPNVYANNYKYSTIREWLNEAFYNTAFTDNEKELIQTTTVDNTAKSTNPDTFTTEFNNGTNEYACSNTQDKVFLLSEQEATSSMYGFNAFVGLAEREILRDDEIGFTVKYDDCNPFGVISGDFGGIVNFSKHRQEPTSNSIIDAFDSLSELFATFIKKDKEDNDYDAYYTDLYNNALAIYNNNSLIAFTKNVSNNNSKKSAIIGIDNDYSKVGSEVPKKIDLVTVIANMFGFRYKTEFTNYAKELTKLFVQYRKNIMNGKVGNEELVNGYFYTANASFVFPIAVKNELSSTVLAYIFLTYNPPKDTSEDDSYSVYVWVNDITAVLWATNYNNDSYHTDSVIENELYCKNLLFIPNYCRYDMVRQKKNTDYAKCQGAWTNTSSGYNEVGTGYWMLRSPVCNLPDNLQLVSNIGHAFQNNYVYYTDGGVVPALRITLG